MMMNMT